MRMYPFGPRSLQLLILPLMVLTQACTVLRYPDHWERDLPKSSLQTTPGPPTTPSTPLGTQTDIEPEPASHVEPMLEFARDLLGSPAPPEVRGRKFNADCSGFVRAVYYSVGLDIAAIGPSVIRDDMSGTEAIFLWATEHATIRESALTAGDLVFFDNTYDRNHNGKLDDTFTHVGIVDNILPSGTIEILHLGSAGVGRIHMNLQRPDTYRDEENGELLNHKLRRQRSTDPAKTSYLTGQLFRAAASPTLGRLGLAMP